MPSSMDHGPLYIDRHQYKGRNVGVLTSGGGAQGMNAALVAIVRVAVYVGCNNGYQGLVDGGDNIQEANWSSVMKIIHLSGTIIGASSSAEFLQRDGRMKAAYNLIKHKISRLIVIGGDATMIGANFFYQEWPNLLFDLWNHGRIDDEQFDTYSNLQIAGIIASIHNDFCGSDIALGNDSAHHRALEVCDAFRTTPNNEGRTLILEVMGKKSGYLALLTCICAGGDYVFIPENPPKPDWRQKLALLLTQGDAKGQKSNIIILADGAVERNGQRITAEDVRTVVKETTLHDARITVLGHLQRGGSPSAFDRVMGCRMGVEAILAVLESTDDTEPCVVTIHFNQMTRVPLLENIERTKSAMQAMADESWELAVKLRGSWFQWLLETNRILGRVEVENGSGDRPGPFRFAVMHIGTAACGMNAAVRYFVKICSSFGHIVYGIYEGMEGLITGKISQLKWNNVRDWLTKGGSYLGSKSTLPTGKYEEIAKYIQENKIQGIFVVGGFEALQAVNELIQQRKQYPEFCIPFIILPAATPNNVPGTDYTLGSDTGLNRITEICDRIRESSTGMKNLVSIIETMGGFCGYLTTMAALACNADAAYINEENVGLKGLEEDVLHMQKKMKADSGCGFILRNEYSSKHYNTDFLHRVYSEEGKGLYTCKQNILGDIQEGGTPSPMDRLMGAILTTKSFEWLVDQCKRNTKRDGTVYCADVSNACLIGITKQKLNFTPIKDVLMEAYIEVLRPKRQWWFKLKSLIKLLSRHESTYDEAGMQRIVTLVFGL